MKRKFVGMTTLEWIHKHRTNEFFGCCPAQFGLENPFDKTCHKHRCEECWALPAKKDGRWILKEVKK